MGSRVSSKLFVPICMLPLLIPAPGKAGDEKAGTASILDAIPADAFFVMRIRSVKDLRRKLDAQPYTGILGRPEAKAIAEELRRKMSEGLMGVKEMLGFDPLDIPGTIEGEAIFALGASEKLTAELVKGMGDGEPDLEFADLPFIWIVDAGASAPRLRENLAKAFASAEKEGAKKEVSDFRGGKITALSHPKDSKDEPPRSRLGRLCAGDLGSRVLLGFHRPFLEEIMANLAAPPAGSLTKSPDFQELQREVGPDGDFSIFLNIRSFSASMRKNLKTDPMPTMIWEFVEGRFFGRSLKGVGFSAAIHESDIRWRIFFQNGGSPEGILGILKGPAIGGKPSPLIPPDAEECYSFSLNIPAIYELLKSQYALETGLDSDGEKVPEFEQFMESKFQLNIKDLIDSLGSTFHFLRKAGSTGEDPLGKYAVALELKKGKAMKEIIDKLMAKSKIQSTKYLEQDIYSLAGRASGASPALAVSDGFFAFGVEEEMVKQLLRRTGKEEKGLGDSPEYRKMAGSVPSQACALAYGSPRSLIPAVVFLKLILQDLGMRQVDLEFLRDGIQGRIGHGLWKEGGLYGETTIFLKTETPRPPP